MVRRDLDPGLAGALVVAVDDSSCSREALRFAARLAGRLGEPLHVLSVWNFLIGRAPERRGDTPPGEPEWQAEAEKRLAALVRQELGERAAAGLHRHAVHGNVVTTLLEVSAVADHLVVGNRGRGGFTGLLLGSTTEQLVRHAECPITVVRSRAG